MFCTAIIVWKRLTSNFPSLRRQLCIHRIEKAFHLDARTWCFSRRNPLDLILPGFKATASALAWTNRLNPPARCELSRLTVFSNRQVEQKSFHIRRMFFCAQTLLATVDLHLALVIWLRENPLLVLPMSVWNCGEVLLVRKMLMRTIVGLCLLVTHDDLLSCLHADWEDRICDVCSPFLPLQFVLCLRPRKHSTLKKTVHVSYSPVSSKGASRLCPLKRSWNRGGEKLLQIQCLYLYNWREETEPTEQKGRPRIPCEDKITQRKLQRRR